MLERRTFQLTEIRAEGDDGESLRISGHAAVFNKKSEPIFGLFREIVLPGAFKKTIKKDDIRALFNHDPNLVLGRNKAKTLRLKEDDTGLRTDIDLPDTQFARDLYTSIKRGDIDQMSFGFRTITDNWRMEGGDEVRELVEVDLFDVSPVTFPAYPQTDISPRLTDAQAEIRSFYEQKIAEIKQKSAEKQPNDGDLADEKDKSATESATATDAPPKPSSAMIEVPSYRSALYRARIVDIEEAKRQESLRRAERLNFLDRRLPKPDPLSYAEILKKSKLTF